MADVSALTQRRKDSPNGAGHYHVTDRYPYHVRVLIDGQEVASSSDVKILKEVGKSLYNPSFYFPPGDVDLTHLEREEGYTTSCPIKGTTPPTGDSSGPAHRWSERPGATRRRSSIRT